MNSVLSGRYSHHLALLLIFLLVGGACAKIGQPSGGNRDIFPPVVLESSPANGATGFKGNRIEIVFDEYVVVDRINEKLMVSPPLEKRPSVLIRGKSLRIDFEEELRDSTTYSFYFLDAIRDLNENNVLDDYRFVFSTGPVIDSLSITGNALYAMDLEVPETASVMLYRDLADSAVVKSLPDYISRVSATGYFRIDNVRKGNYRLYALADNDNSKTYNNADEPFAFLERAVTVTPENNYIEPLADTLRRIVNRNQKDEVQVATDQNAGLTTRTGSTALKGEYQLYMFTAPPSRRYLGNSSRDSRYRLMYVLSLPPDTMHFSFSIPDAGESSYMIVETADRDTITVWLTDSTVYSRDVINTVIEYPFTDTLGNDIYMQDTLAMRFFSPKARIQKGPAALSLRNNVPGGNLKPGQSIVLTSETPLADPDTSLIYLYEVRDKKRSEIPFSLNRDSGDLRKLYLDAKFTEGSQYLLVTDSASIRNIYDQTVDSAALRITVREAESYSSLTLNIANCDTTCIIQLLDNTEKIMGQKTISSEGSVTFDLLEKGTYRAKAIFDLDRDGKWTTGDYFKNRQPEPVTYFPKELVIQAGWQVIEDWDLSQKNFKDPKMRKAVKTTKPGR